MKLTERIEAFLQLGEYIATQPAAMLGAVGQSYLNNNWFTRENCLLAIEAVRSEFLRKTALTTWLSQYNELENIGQKTVGLVLAGNLPGVGFHDVLCVLVLGHTAQIKLSSKDKFIIPFLLAALVEIEPRFKEQISFVERLKGFDAVIATGSNNSARYFDYYFKNVPNIIRRNRTSVAVLSGKETEEDLKLIQKDVFSFYGLGCRNVSKLFVKKDFDFIRFMDLTDAYKAYGDHHKYKNNYDYHRSILLLNSIHHYSNDFFMMSESEQHFAPISTLHYAFYEDIDSLQKKLAESTQDIQCVVAKDEMPFATIPLGKAQTPGLSDYADGIDTIQFLLAI